MLRYMMRMERTASLRDQQVNSPVVRWLDCSKYVRTSSYETSHEWTSSLETCIDRTTGLRGQTSRQQT